MGANEQKPVQFFGFTDTQMNTTHKIANTITPSTTPAASAAMVAANFKTTQTQNEATLKPTSMTYLSSALPSPTNILIIPGQQASTLATNAAKKIRCAFSMPRNPFRWSRKFKTTKTTLAAYNDAQSSNTGRNVITSCMGGGCDRSGSIISLNSNDTLVCKDINGVQKQTQQISNATKTEDVQGSTNRLNENTSSNGNKQRYDTKASCNNSMRIMRRSFFRKIFSRIAQQLSNSVKIGANNYAISATTNTATAITTAAKTSHTSVLITAQRVPLIGGYQWPADQTPGVMGLKNHGNTCFMNAVLQCLSHTDILAEYFVLDQYKADLKRRNKINSRKFGTKGELTEQLANVLKALWMCKNENDHSTSFKAVVDRYGSQFRSSTQHDAQEFLFWLLDKVHEDLNTATKRRYKSVKNTYGRPDEVIAAETLANHIRCNNSFVQAVFQAQFRSSLTCPRCKKQSNTFDPFHCISVQLPQLTQQTIFATIVYMHRKPRQVKIGLTVPAGSTIMALREQLQRNTGISTESMVLVDLNKNGFTRVFYDTQPVETLSGIETIYCIEVPEIKPTSSDETSKPVKDITTDKFNIANYNWKKSDANIHDLLLLVLNVHKKKKSSMGNEDIKYEYQRFGAPFSMKAPRDSSFTELQKKMLREMSTVIKPEVFSYTIPLNNMFKIRLQDPSADPETYLEEVEHPLLTEMIDMALSVLSAEAGPTHVKLLLEWTIPEEYFQNMSHENDEVVDDESVARLSASKCNDTAALTLEQCLEHYTKAETLSAEDAWRCPQCQQYLPVVKTLGLWSLPDILVVHFKRFRQHQEKGAPAEKLTTMVKFPLNAFDMSPHLARGINGESSVSSLEAQAIAATNYRPSSWKKTRVNDSRSSTLNSHIDRKDTRYDLYAVCYHQGDTLETGHYTAACKNPYDRQWYKFDDQRVSKVVEQAVQEQIINNEAYILFYQRRNADASVECLVSSSTSSDHWVSRLVPPVVNTNTFKEKNLNELLKTKLEQKEQPVKIPKIINDIEEGKTETEVTLTEPVVIKSTNNHNLINIEKIDFSDSDTSAQADKENSILTTLKECSPNGNSSGCNYAIFIMDDKYTKEESLKRCVLNNTDTDNALPEVITTTVAVLPPTTAVAASSTIAIWEVNANIVPQDIRSRSASNTPTSSSSTSSLSVSFTPQSLEVAMYAAEALHTKFNGQVHNNYNDLHHEIQLFSSLKRHTDSINGIITHEFQLTRHHLQNHNALQHHSNWHGSRASVLADENAIQQNQRQTTSLKLRHSFTTNSNYKLREYSEMLSLLLRNSANICSKDTLLFIDQQNHHHHSSLIEDDTGDTYMGRSLWILPVTSHKLITVSPKN